MIGSMFKGPDWRIVFVVAKVGGTVLANACGPCIGQWKRTDVAMGMPKCPSCNCCHPSFGYLYCEVMLDDYLVLFCTLHHHQKSSSFV